jgi:prepilin-type N-terminal cleavage/methylation domain-containing protein/prepilin-type processing-associated H-X9-DG protein
MTMRAPTFSPARRRATRAFTLIELICVVAIMALLASLLFPSLQSVRQRALSVACASNLRQIGLALNMAAQDNDNQYPEIEPDPASTLIYPAADGAKGLLATLQPYGITTNTVRCPADTGGSASNFAIHGTSYQWMPLADGETAGDIQVYMRNRVFPDASSHLRVCLDFTAVHFGRVNWLYADGHVKWVTK